MKQLFGKLVRRAFRMTGLEVFRVSSLPRGIKLDVDLRRIIGTSAPVLFDVGANIGQTSEFLVSTFPNAKIFAFEPIESTFGILQKRVAKWKTVEPNRIAFGERNGDMLMELAAQSSWSRIVEDVAAVADAQLEKVSMRTLDSFCREIGVSHIQLLKTDCEGYDLQVLKGAMELLKGGAIDCIYSEVNFRRDGRHADFFEIEELLAPLHYSFYALYNYSSWRYDVTSNGFANGLWVSSNLLARGCK